MNLKESLDLLNLASNSLATALESIHKAAHLDDKTTLQNALALDEAKDIFAISSESANVVVFADINDFKSINTQYGYVAGDTAIRRVGELCKRICRGLQSTGFSH
jgi:GGDEF domain-containing protein